MRSFAVTVETTATVVVPADIETRTVYFHNESGKSVYLGGSDVSSTNGYHLKNNETLTMIVPGNENLYGVVTTTTGILHVLRPSDA